MTDYTVTEKQKSLYERFCNIPTWVKFWRYNLLTKIFWKFVPGTRFRVKWPIGLTEPNEHGVCVDSADPNDHYRPEMTRLVGRQRIDWDWDLLDNDIADNMLTIKIRKGKDNYVSYFAAKWS